jgi:hypothetical protein
MLLKDEEKMVVVKEVYWHLRLKANTIKGVKVNDKNVREICRIIENCGFEIGAEQGVIAWLVNNNFIAPPKASHFSTVADQIELNKRLNDRKEREEWKYNKLV